MAGLKALAKETAIYGMSSIIGRFLNYLLVPIYTNALPVESGGVWYHYQYVCYNCLADGAFNYMVWKPDFPVCQ